MMTARCSGSSARPERTRCATVRRAVPRRSSCRTPVRPRGRTRPSPARRRVRRAGPPYPTRRPPAGPAGPVPRDRHRPARRPARRAAGPAGRYSGPGRQRGGDVARMAVRVVLPDPFGPMMPMTSPPRQFRLTPATASVAPNTTVRSRISSRMSERSGISSRPVRAASSRSESDTAPMSCPAPANRPRREPSGTQPVSRRLSASIRWLTLRHPARAAPTVFGTIPLGLKTIFTSSSPPVTIARYWPNPILVTSCPAMPPGVVSAPPRMPPEM